MTSEDVQQEIDRDPIVPLRLHLFSGQVIPIEYPDSAFVRQNTVLVVHRLAPCTSAIGNYDVVALRPIERIEQVNGAHGSSGTSTKRRKR